MQMPLPTPVDNHPTATATATPSPVPTVTRVRGGVLMVLGPLISLGTGAGLIALGPELLQAAGTASAAPLDAERTQAAVLLMAWVCLLGLLFTVAGWQLWRQGRFGRRTGWLAAGMVALLMAALPWVKRLFA